MQKLNLPFLIGIKPQVGISMDMAAKKIKWTLERVKVKMFLLSCLFVGLGVRFDWLGFCMYKQGSAGEKAMGF